MADWLLTIVLLLPYSASLVAAAWISWRHGYEAGIRERRR